MISLIFNLLLLIFKICEPIFLKHLDLFLPLLKHQFFPWIYNLINFVEWISLIFSWISMPFSFFFCLLQFILNPCFKQNIIILSNSFFFYWLVLQFIDFMVDIVNEILFIIIFFQIVQVFFCVVGLLGSIVPVEDFLFIFLVLRGLDGPERVCFQAFIVLGIDCFIDDLYVVVVCFIAVRKRKIFIFIFFHFI